MSKNHRLICQHLIYNYLNQQRLACPWNLHGEHSGLAEYASVSTMPSCPILSRLGEPPLGLPNKPRSPQPI